MDAVSRLVISSRLLDRIPFLLPCLPITRQAIFLPIKEIGELLKDHPAAFNVDAVQAIGKVPVYPERVGN